MSKLSKMVVISIENGVLKYRYREIHDQNQQQDKVDELVIMELDH